MSCGQDGGAALERDVAGHSHRDDVRQRRRLPARTARQQLPVTPPPCPVSQLSPSIVEARLSEPVQTRLLKSLLRNRLKGRKCTAWDGGTRVTSMVTGGFVPAALRGTTSTVLMHVAGKQNQHPLHSTFSCQLINRRAAGKSPFVHASCCLVRDLCSRLLGGR